MFCLNRGSDWQEPMETSHSWQDSQSSHFFWSKDEAEEAQVEQIGVSACGATAVINVLKVLKLDHDVETINSAIHTRLRAEDAPLHEYLFSRALAGTVADDLIEGFKKVAGDKVYARFYHFFPKRKVNLIDWLREWMKMGVVPLMTLNLQRGVKAGEEIPDAWHHQMVFGVDSDHVHLCNPIVACAPEILEEQLCSESVLKIRREDILSRIDSRCDLEGLNRHSDVRWSEMDVKGQVLKVLREEVSLSLPDTAYFQVLKKWLFASHICIPAEYKSGITLCCTTDNKEAYEKLKNSSDLPWL